MNKYYKIILVGGDPDDAAMLSSKLAETLRDVQSAGWVIEQVSEVPIARAWSCKQQTYMPFKEYVIVMWANRDKVHFD